jgi:hypothetical protein
VNNFEQRKYTNASYIEKVYFAEKSRGKRKKGAKLLPQFLEAGQTTSPFLFVSCISVDFISFKSKLV